MVHWNTKVNTEWLNLAEPGGEDLYTLIGPFVWITPTFTLQCPFHITHTNIHKTCSRPVPRRWYKLPPQSPVYPIKHTSTLHIIHSEFSPVCEIFHLTIHSPYHTDKDQKKPADPLRAFKAALRYAVHWQQLYGTNNSFYPSDIWTGSWKCIPGKQSSKTQSGKKNEIIQTSVLFCHVCEFVH